MAILGPNLENQQCKSQNPVTQQLTQSACSPKGARTLLITLIISVLYFDYFLPEAEIMPVRVSLKSFAAASFSTVRCIR